jgi:hypothetical protein
LTGLAQIYFDHVKTQFESQENSVGTGCSANVNFDGTSVNKKMWNWYVDQGKYIYPRLVQKSD